MRLNACKPLSMLPLKRDSCYCYSRFLNQNVDIEYIFISSDHVVKGPFEHG